MQKTTTLYSTIHLYQVSLLESLDPLNYLRRIGAGQYAYPCTLTMKLSTT